MNATLDRQAIIDALTEPPNDHVEPIHQRIERECWKLHSEDFNKCQEPSCVFLKRIAWCVGWNIGMNGITPTEHELKS